MVFCPFDWSTVASQNESIHDPRGWCTLGRETAIKGDMVQRIVARNRWWKAKGAWRWKHLKRVTPHPYEKLPERTNFEQSELPPQFQTVRVPFTKDIGILKEGKLTLRGAGSLANTWKLLVARRWQSI